MLQIINLLLPYSSQQGHIFVLHAYIYVVGIGINADAPEDLSSAKSLDLHTGQSDCGAAIIVDVMQL